MSSDVCFLVHSQDLGPEDCTANVSLSTFIIEIPTGTVCVECIINGELDTDAMFQLQGVKSIQGEDSGWCAGAV